MATPLSPEEIEIIARRRAGAKLGWYIHATVYVVVNTALVLMAIAHGRNWAVFPLVGWGVGLALHGISVFLIGKGSGLRERMVQREREKLQRERGGGS
jgi:hypothetical protein